MIEKTRYRLYGFVPRSLSDLQKGIQFGHAAIEYSLVNQNNPAYKQWSQEDKTFIILNGGTTNLGKEGSGKGSLNLHMETLINEFQIPVAPFYEPDLGDQLSAFVFLVPDNVWDKEKYPDFYWRPDNRADRFDSQKRDEAYSEWIESIGGEEIASLREYLNKLRLA